jgi:hypothetical protein
LRYLYATVLLAGAGSATLFFEIQAHGTSLTGMMLLQMLMGGGQNE